MLRRSFAISFAAALLGQPGFVKAQTARQERAVSGFDQIAWRAAGELRITQGANEGLIVEAEPRLLPRIIADVKGGVLDIRFAEGEFSTRHPIRFHVSVKSLRSLHAGGSGNISLERLDTPSLHVELSGSGALRIGSLATPRLAVKMIGSANVEIAGGHATFQSIELSGSGGYDAAALATEESTVSIGGSGIVTVMASRKLTANISGAGTVQYVGSPRVIESVSGAGHVRKLHG